MHSSSSTTRTQARRSTYYAALACVLMCLVGIGSLFIGSSGSSVHTTLAVLAGNRDDPVATTIILNQRVPRALAGALAGMCLGLATVLIQGMVRNPLAEPGLLGVNAGAGLAVAVSIVLGVTAPFAHLGWAFVGASATGVVVLLLGGAFHAHPQPARLILAGAALSASLSAIGGFLVLNYPNAYADFRHWDSGALTYRPAPLFVAAAVIVLLAMVAAPAVCRGLDLLASGHDFARSLGVNITAIWSGSALLALLLCAAATTLAGPISFIGLLASIFARNLTQGSFSRACLLAGFSAGTLLICADVIGRLVAQPAEIEAGIISAMIGGPGFVLLALRWHSRWKT